MMKKPSYIFNESYTTTEGTRAYRLVMGFNSLKDMEEAFELIMSGKLFQKPPENPVLDANRCRIARMKNGQSYPKSSCEQCGTLMRPGWKCAMGIEND